MRAIAFLFATATLVLTGPLSAQTSEPSSQARISFDARHILSAQVSGKADRSSGRLVTVDDPVRVASISKLYVALAVMRLVEADKIDLDRDVSDVLGWRLRNPAFPEAKITLRLLLSHQSSLSDDAEYLIPVDQTVRSKLAEPKAWDKAHAPGTWFRYTNLNFPVIASVLEAATGERFDRLMMRTVLKPLKLDACFNWSGCSDTRLAQAVVLYNEVGGVRRDDLKGVRPPCPGVAAADGSCDLSGYQLGWNGAIFSPQGGLRISARDLARTGQMLLRGGKGFLTPASFATLTAPAWRFNGSNGDSEGGFYCAYGLAVQPIGGGGEGCHDEPFGDGHLRLGHAGEAYGLRSGLWVDRQTGQGIAYFVTAVPDDAPRGKTAFYAVEEALIKGR
jgi:CubicO group peptidase (beta-lactamase class C family)